MKTSIASALSNDPPNIEWAKSYGDLDYDEKVYSLIGASDGGYVIAGWRVPYPEEVSSYSNVFLMKIDKFGNLQWGKTIGKYCGAYSVIETNDGGYAVTGCSLAELVLFKTDSLGNVEWGKNYGGYPHYSGECVIQTKDGGYAIAGWAGYSITEPSEPWDGCLIKVDSSGETEWIQRYGGESSDYIFSVVECSEGGYALSGSTVSYGVEDHDFWLVRTDSQGKMLWNKTYGGDGYDQAESLLQMEDGGFVVAGAYDWDGNWLIKTDSLGEMQWNSTYYSSGYGARDLAKCNDGGFVTVGQRLIKFDSSGEIQWVANEGGMSVVQTADGGFAVIRSEKANSQTRYDEDVVLIKYTGTSGEPTDRNTIEISVDMAPGRAGSEAIDEFLEREKTMDTHIYVSIDKNAHFVSSVKLEYEVGHGVLPSTTETRIMQLQSDSRYHYEVEAWDIKGQKFEGNLAEYLTSALMNFYGIPGILAPIFVSVDIPDYTLTKVIVVDIYGQEHNFEYNLPIKSLPDWIASMIDGTYGAGLSPIDMIITDSQGRHLGSLYQIEDRDPVFVGIINQIPGACYNKEADFFYLPSDLQSYDLSIVGLESGNYTLVTLSIKDDNGYLEEKSSAIQRGEIQSYKTEIFTDGKLVVSEISPLPLPTPTETEPKSDGATNYGFLLPFGISIEMLLAIGSVVAVIIVALVAYKLAKRKSISKTNVNNSEDVSISDI